MPHGKQSVIAYRETMLEISMCLDQHLHTTALWGVDANVSMRGFEDGRFVGLATLSLKKQLVPPLNKNAPLSSTTSCLRSTCEWPTLRHTNAVRLEQGGVMRKGRLK